MKYIKSYILFALMVMAVSGCKTDDLKDDVNDLKDRVTLLEEQVKILNDNIEAMAYILAPGNLTISKVKESTDKSQFTITLSNGDELTLTIGEPGEVATPSIEVSEDGYWIINDVKTQYKAIGDNGDNGNGIPQFKVIEGKWMVSFDGNSWNEVDGGDIDEVTDTLGEQLFKSAEIVEEGNSKYFVITTLKSEVIKLSVTGLTCKINVETETTQPISFTAGEIKDFDVEISGGEPLAPVYPAGWRAELTKKTEAVDGYNYTLTVYAPATRAAVADNSSDISVRVTDGTSWAVDKITVTQ